MWNLGITKTRQISWACAFLVLLTAMAAHSQGPSGDSPEGGSGLPGGGMRFPGGGPTPDIAVSEIGPNLYLLSKGRLGNSVVLTGSEGALLVDSAFNATLGGALLEAIRRIHDGRIAYLINTHFHGDHTGANVVFGERGAIIIAHEAVRSSLVAGSRRTGPAPPQALPDVTYGNGQAVTVHLNGETIQVMHLTPAHTPDNSVVHFRNANVLAVADIFSPARYPVFDGTTSRGALDALDAVLATTDADSRFVPGWGEVASRAEVLAYREMIVTVRNRVETLIREGKTLEEVMASNPTEEFDETWGSPDNPRFLPVIYNEIKGTP